MLQLELLPYRKETIHSSVSITFIHTAKKITPHFIAKKHSYKKQT